MVVHSHRSAEPLGERLGLAVLRAAQAVVPGASSGGGAELKLRSTQVKLPRVAAHDRLARLEVEQKRLLDSLGAAALQPVFGLRRMPWAAASALVIQTPPMK